MNKYPFPTSSQYNIIIEAETEEIAQQILNTLNVPPKKKIEIFKE